MKIELLWQYWQDLLDGNDLLRKADLQLHFSSTELHLTSTGRTKNTQIMR